jgi:hypothetical protein
VVHEPIMLCLQASVFFIFIEPWTMLQAVLWIRIRSDPELFAGSGIGSETLRKVGSGSEKKSFRIHNTGCRSGVIFLDLNLTIKSIREPDSVLYQALVLGFEKKFHKKGILQDIWYGSGSGTIN